MIKIKLPSEVYEKFFHVLVQSVRKKLGGAAHTVSGEALWTLFSESTYYRSLFKSKKLSEYHFFRKLEQLGEPTHLISFDRDLFCDALEFIGYKIPAKKTDTDYTYKERFQDWGTKFLLTYFENKPEYIDIVINCSWKNTTKLPAPSVDYSIGRYHSLDDKIYTTEYRQGHLIDRAVLRLKTHGNSEISGVFEVLYQNPDLSYKEVTEKLMISGWFNYNGILALRYKNADLLKEHCGVFLFVINTEADKIIGTYVAHYNDMPPIRESRIGNMTLIKCDDESYAQKFIDEWKGKPAPKNADRIIKNWEMKYKTVDSINTKLTAWLREDKSDKEIDTIISQLISK
ncbi:MAG: hypothetical protein JNK00_01745 [Flavipsychrobacter sp.]|nr:hypothetical protein [Flavipsychrobacter sp.]